MTDRYMEFVGGLGDAILRMYFSGEAWYGPLESMQPEDRATVVLMCHNPYLREIFEWHPKRAQIDLRDLGFTTPFHPWENKDWRLKHGLPPEAPCPPYFPARTLKFFPSEADLELLRKLADEQFVILAGTAGEEKRSIPPEVRHLVASAAVDAGFKVLVVGRSRYFRGVRVGDLEHFRDEGVIDAVDRLSVPGTIEAVKLAAGVVACNSAVVHMAWQEYRPVLFLYDDYTRDILVPRGPVGYTQGLGRPDGDHMHFNEYTQRRARKWLHRLA